MSMVLRHEVSFSIHFDTLLQIATDNIANCHSYFIKNATEICYKMRPFYSKMRQLLQIATILLQNAMFITNCQNTFLRIGNTF